MSLFGAKKAPTSEISASAPKTPLVSRKTVGFETVIGANTTLHGELRTQADVRIDGTFEGTLEIEGNVLVGETGKINADIHAKNVSVAGGVRGDISGKKVQILRTARVWGNISASAITTEEGAFIDGKLSITQHEAAVQNLPAPNPITVPDEGDNTTQDEELEVLEGEPVEEDDTPDATSST